MVLPVFTLQAFIISLATGAVGALLGLGGGVFMVPLLVFLLGVPLQVAAGASILAVLATSIAAAAKYVKDDMTNLRLGLFLELATTLGALTGAFTVSVPVPPGGVSEVTLRSYARNRLGHQSIIASRPLVIP